MSDVQEDTSPPGEAGEEQQEAQEDLQKEEAPVQEAETEEEEGAAAAAEVPEGEEEKPPGAEETAADAPQEDEDQKPAEEAGEGEEKPADDEKPAEGGEPAEGEEQGDTTQPNAETSEGDGAEPKGDVDSSETVDGVEQVAQAEGGGAVEDAEPAEQGEASETDKPTDEDAEKPAEEGEEGAEKAEAQEGGEQVAEGEQPAADAEAAETGEAPAEPTEEQQAAPEGAEAEAEEGPIVGERLSRGATPEVDQAVIAEQERLEATTPEGFGEPEMLEGEGEGEEDEAREGMDMVEGIEMVEEEDEEPQFRREELIERYHEALLEREQFQQQNYLLQHKLAEYFRKKKADERQDYDKNVTDQEQRYLKYMAQLEDLRRQDAMEQENYRAQIEDAKDRCQDKKEKVDAERKKFMEFKKNVALNAINSRSGKPIPAKDIEQYMVNEVKKEQEVVNVRLENIKLKNKLKKKEQQLKSKEELAEGLHLIDFEQLKIENQTYNEKIEERNEELLKLRKKITSTVQVLTHLKEKLQFVQVENLEQNNNLKEVEASLAQSRDILSRTKQARDALRIDNHKLRQSCGLLGNEPLLRDFEERKDEGDDLRGKLEQLKMKHAELTLHCNQVRRKIDQARQTMR